MRTACGVLVYVPLSHCDLGMRKRYCSLSRSSSPVCCGVSEMIDPPLVASEPYLEPERAGKAVLVEIE